MKLKVVIWQEEDSWCVSVPALPGCHTWGESYEHAMDMAQEAIEAWLGIEFDKQDNLEKNNSTKKILELNL